MIEPSLPPLLFGTLQMPLMFAILMPAMQHLQHWRTRANDILKPIRREDYLREMGLSLAIDVARNVAVVLVVGLGMNLLVRPTDLQPGTVLPVLLVTGLAAIFCVGALAWLLRYRSILVAVIPCFVIFGLYMLLVADWRDAAAQWRASCTAVILALIGLWLARDAYRRWLLTDLG
jgi:hypothetical protein